MFPYPNAFNEQQKRNLEHVNDKIVTRYIFDTFSFSNIAKPKQVTTLQQGEMLYRVVTNIITPFNGSTANIDLLFYSSIDSGTPNIGVTNNLVLEGVIFNQGGTGFIPTSNGLFLKKLDKKHEVFIVVRDKSNVQSTQGDGQILLEILDINRI